MKSSKHVYNFHPDLPDFRDHKYSAKIAPVGVLPAKVDLRAQQCPVVDQGQEGSCTANAGTAFMGFLELKQIQAQAIGPKIFMPYSRNFLYYNERMIEGSVKQDSGATLRDCMKALYSWGVPYESQWTYNPDNTFTKPFEDVYHSAQAHKISWYLRINSLNDMKQCLASGHPFVYGFTVYEFFESAQVAATGIVPMPGPSEAVLGGHAVLACGYDDSTQTVLTKNSWGVGWGQAGYFQMPYAYLSDSDLTSDCWTIRR